MIVNEEYMDHKWDKLDEWLNSSKETTYILLKLCPNHYDKWSKRFIESVFYAAMGDVEFEKDRDRNL